MSTLELRNDIYKQISLIDDESFLTALKTIIDLQVSSGTYKLSDIQMQRIASGREQLKNGSVLDDDEVQRNVEAWLNTK